LAHGDRAVRSGYFGDRLGARRSLWIIPLASCNRGDNVHGVDRRFRSESASRSTPVVEAHGNQLASAGLDPLDVPPEKAKEIAEAASQTDGIIFHLWPVGAKVPNGEVMFPTAVSHKPVEKIEIPK
jgi:hypothetical protein